MTRASWGKAKVVVYALKSEILTLHLQGQNLEEIFHSFSTRLTTGKSTFKRHASAIIKAEHHLPDITNRPTPSRLVNGILGASTPAPKPLRPSTDSPPSHFNHSPEATEETISEIWGDDS